MAAIPQNKMAATSTQYGPLATYHAHGTSPAADVVQRRASGGPSSTTRAVLVHVMVVLMVLTTATASDYHDEYDYGDPNYHYDDMVLAERVGLARGQDAARYSTPLPLCCPPGHVFDYMRCRAVQQGELWEPHLDASPSALYSYSSGFPRCTNSKRADLFQSDVFVTNTSLYVPHYLQLHPLHLHHYCVVKVQDPQDLNSGACPRYCTKVYACIDGDKAMMGGAWTLVGVSHLLLLLAVIAFVVIPELRVLQGQYLLCFLITLLIYNVLLFPTSALSFPSSVVSCIALRAIKYFFFCGVFLWFNVVCFDVWRTLKCGKDITGRRRFVLYSVYTWLFGAVLVTPVMVLSISTGAASSSSTDVPGQDLPVCSVGLGVHVVLQLVQGITMLINTVMLAVAASHLCHYNKLGCGLSRTEASMCLKQTVKLYVVMVWHSVFSVSPEILDLHVIQMSFFLIPPTPENSPNSLPTPENSPNSLPTPENSPNSLPTPENSPNSPPTPENSPNSPPPADCGSLWCWRACLSSPFWCTGVPSSSWCTAPSAPSAPPAAETGSLLQKEVPTAWVSTTQGCLWGLPVYRGPGTDYTVTVRSCRTSCLRKSGFPLSEIRGLGLLCMWS
ncbi:hypothetical protein FHG87_014417 [Trinorchestia longiramus]|nr:hypothetical protein FHG87_014417 [Trinorchestia longiramus]